MIIAPTPETLAGQPLSVLVQMGRETLDVLGHVAERLGIATYDTYMDLVHDDKPCSAGENEEE